MRILNIELVEYPLESPFLRRQPVGFGIIIAKIVNYGIAIDHRLGFCQKDADSEPPFYQIT